MAWQTGGGWLRALELGGWEPQPGRGAWAHGDRSRSGGQAGPGHVHGRSWPALGLSSRWQGPEAGPGFQGAVGVCLPRGRWWWGDDTLFTHQSPDLTVKDADARCGWHLAAASVGVGVPRTAEGLETHCRPEWAGGGAGEGKVVEARPVGALQAHPSFLLPDASSYTLRGGGQASLQQLSSGPAGAAPAGRVDLVAAPSPWPARRATRCPAQVLPPAGVCWGSQGPESSPLLLSLRPAQP